MEYCGILGILNTEYWNTVEYCLNVAGPLTVSRTHLQQNSFCILVTHTLYASQSQRRMPSHLRTNVLLPYSLPCSLSWKRNIIPYLGSMSGWKSHLKLGTNIRVPLAVEWRRAMAALGDRSAANLANGKTPLGASSHWLKTSSMIGIASNRGHPESLPC